MQDESPPTARDWNADERSRAQTRALLMSLSRKREPNFVLPVGWVAVIAILQFGLRAPIGVARLFDRWQRLEWPTYAELARWMHDRTADPIARDLITFADNAADTRAKRWQTLPFSLIALAILIVIGVATNWDWRMLLATAFAPAWQPVWNASLAPLICGYSFVIAFAWVSILMLNLRHQAAVTMWLTQCSTLMAAHDKRPVVLPRRSVPVAYLLMAIVVGSVCAPWIGAMLVVIGMQNRYIIATRAVRLAFIERMLEWMDQSGLPVEFDVEEMAPDAIAATLA